MPELIARFKIKPSTRIPEGSFAVVERTSPIEGRLIFRENDSLAATLFGGTALIRLSRANKAAILVVNRKDYNDGKYDHLINANAG